MKSAFLALILLLLAPYGRAEELRLGQAALDQFAKLQSLGVNKVGALDIRALEKAAANQVSWAYNESGEIPSFAGSRRSAYFRVAPHRVAVSRHLPAFAEAFYASLEVHETLGALGYNDQNYALSMALRLLAETKSDAMRASLQKTFGKTLFARAELREGGSSVGSGGDLIGLSAKSLLLDRILADEEVVTQEFLAFFPKLRFEPRYDTNAKYFSVEYRVDSKIRGNQNVILPMTDPRVYYVETITIFLPAKEWSRSAKAREKLLADMQEMIVGIFPASPNFPTKTRVVTGCDSKLKIAFPVTKSYQAAYVQERRVGLRPDCKQKFGYGNTIVVEFH